MRIFLVTTLSILVLCGCQEPAGRSEAFLQSYYRGLDLLERYRLRAAERTELTPVIVELFTSQGCSSCPPADELLSSLERNQPVAGAWIIPLGMHVDYWNHLGWRDPFSSKQFSARQKAYVHALEARSVYTPMMVVDGQRAFVGSQSVTARDAVVSALRVPKARLSIDLATGRNESTLRVAVSTTGLADRTDGEVTEVWLAVTEGGMRTEVTHGENAFRTLTHTAVVRWLAQIGSIPPIPGDRFAVRHQVRLRPTWQRANLRVVVFLQERSSRRIVGAAQAPLL